MFDEGRYKDTIIGVLDYVDSSLVKRTGNKDQTSFAIPHGSLTIYLTITDTEYSIFVPFLKLPPKNQVALMRQVLEVSFHPLILTKIVLKDDQLCFEYKSPLELAEPYKIYGILQEICNTADYYDDVFVEKFGAQPVEEVKAEKFPPEKVEKAWEKFQEYLNEALAYYNFFESKRLYPFCWDVLCTGLMKIDYFMEPQGFLRSEMEKAIAGLNSPENLNEKLMKTKAIIEKLKTYPKEKFEQVLYMPEYLITAKKRCDLAGVQNALGQIYNNAKNEIGSRDYMGATLSLLFGIMNLYYRFDIPAEIRMTLNKGLINSSKQPWNEAATALFNAITIVMDMKQEQQLPVNK